MAETTVYNNFLKRKQTNYRCSVCETELVGVTQEELLRGFYRTNDDKDKQSHPLEQKVDTLATIISQLALHMLGIKTWEDKEMLQATMKQLEETFGIAPQIVCEGKDPAEIASCKELAEQERERRLDILKHRDEVIDRADKHIKKYGYAEGDASVLMEHLLIILQEEK